MQLSFFEPEELAPKPMVKGMKRCPTCGTNFKVKKSYQSYCNGCRKKHSANIKRLKSENPIPVDHVCPVCKRSEVDITNVFGGKFAERDFTPWRLDHCHKTGMFRDYLCNECNIGMGKFRDDPAILEQALEYAKMHNGTS
jgi:uncharacterized C2H2 Zn-finger protein